MTGHKVKVSRAEILGLLVGSSLPTLFLHISNRLSLYLSLTEGDRACSGEDFDEIPCMEDFKGILETMFKIITILNPKHYGALYEKHNELKKK
jgi:hypothetical protein